MLTFLNFLFFMHDFFLLVVFSGFDLYGPTFLGFWLVVVFEIRVQLQMGN